MNRRKLVLILIALFVVFTLLAVWIWRSGIIGGAGGGNDRLASATNPALDIRYQYDPSVLTPAPYDQRAEYPLQLNGEGWTFHGKRIAGLGRMLDSGAAPMVYDFVASQHAEMYEDWYRLKRVREEYEDCTIQERLGVHCSWTYEQTDQTTPLPLYMSEEVRSGDTIESEGWALYTENDLFYFYTFSSTELTDYQRAAVLQVLESIEFNVLAGNAAENSGRSAAPQ